MMPFRIYVATFGLLCAGSAMAQPAPTVRVYVEGSVHAPGPFDMPAGSRISDAVLAAKPTRDAWPTGASLLRDSAARDQVRLKAALLHDLDQLGKSESPEVRDTAARLSRLLEAMPVTGRVQAQLDARRLEVQRESNRPLVVGDRIVYAVRPEHVRVYGAVVDECDLRHESLRDASDYLQSCPRTSVADRDWMYVVQPDGAVQRLGIALWNRSAAQALAPGATLYVPLRATVTKALDGDFNEDFAHFIATQLIEPQSRGASP